MITSMATCDILVLFSSLFCKRSVSFRYSILWNFFSQHRVAISRFEVLFFLVWSNKLCRFVQFGADQDCHCGAAGCRRKLGVRPTKPKISSDAALKLVAYQVALSSPKLKAYLSRKDVCIGFPLFFFPS